MKSINRFAIVVRLKEPYLVWARSIDDGDPDPETCSVYLADADENEPPEDVLRRHFAEIFEEQLESWHLDTDRWPKVRTPAVFEQWFDARVVDLVFDLADEPIEHDEY
ncbi:MAG: hypothetical protein RIC55_24775 [Pirellulaceae bacterium]